MIELNEREQKRYSIRNAINADAARRSGDRRANAFELEVSQEIQRHLNEIHAGYQYRGGVLVPTDLALVQQRAGLDTATPTKGHELVFDEPGSFIDLLRARTVVLRLGATFLPGLQGEIGFPRETAGGVVTWGPENPGTNTAASDLALDRVFLSPRTAQSTTSFSRQLLAQSTPAVDGVVANDLAKIHAVALDHAALQGVAPAPTGIIPRVGSVDFATDPVFGCVVAMDMALYMANAGNDPRGLAYVADPIAAATLQITPQAATIGMPAWYENQMNGHRAEITMNMPAASLLLGDWPDVLIGEWGVLEIITDPFAKKKQGMIEVTSFHLADVELRHVESFCKSLNFPT